ncbi:hypothetical protein [Mesorhizobium sp. A623]
MRRRTMQQISYILESAAKFLSGILTAIHAVISAICRFLGLTPPPPPTPPRPSTTAEDVRDEYRDAHDREVSNDHAFASNVGMTVYQFANALDPAVRGAIDLEGLSPSQIDWLLGLSEADLQKLVTAGPKACELAATGKRSGVVGLPTPQTETAPAIEGPHPVRNLLLERIRANVAREKLRA